MASGSWVSEGVCNSSFAFACSFGYCRGAVCVCNAGYVNNRLFTRVSDCSVPDWLFDCTMIISLVFGLLGVFTAACGARVVRGQTRRSVVLFGAASVCSLAASIDGLIEQNTGRAFFVFMGGLHIFMHSGFGVLLDLVSFSHYNRKSQRLTNFAKKSLVTPTVSTLYVKCNLDGFFS